MVIGSDVIYYSEDAPALAAAILAHTSPTGISLSFSPSLTVCVVCVCVCVCVCVSVSVARARARALSLSLSLSRTCVYPFVVGGGEVKACFVFALDHIHVALVPLCPCEGLVS